MGRAKKNQVCFPSYKVKPETIESLKQTAIESGYKYGDGAAMGEFLDKLAALDREIQDLIDDSVEFAENSPEPDPSELRRYIFAED